MSPIILSLADDDVGKIAVLGGLCIALGLPIVSMIMGTIRSTANTRAREESRREIAAYVAEGSISPADAERLLAAGESPDKKNC